MTDRKGVYRALKEKFLIEGSRLRDEERELEKRRKREQGIIDSKESNLSGRIGKARKVIGNIQKLKELEDWELPLVNKLGQRDWCYETSWERSYYFVARGKKTSGYYLGILNNWSTTKMIEHLKDDPLYLKLAKMDRELDELERRVYCKESDSYDELRWSIKGLLYRIIFRNLREREYADLLSGKDKAMRRLTRKSSALRKVLKENPVRTPLKYGGFF